MAKQLALSILSIYLITALIFSSDFFIYRFVSYYTNSWLFSEIALRLIIVLTGISLFQLLFSKSKWPSLILFGVLSFIFIDTIIAFFGYDDFAVLVSFSYYPVESIVFSLLMLLLYLSFLVKFKPIYIRVPKWLTVLLFIVGLGLGFAKPIYIVDWYAPKNFKVESLAPLKEFIENNGFDTKNNTLVAFFTTGCPHCNEAAFKMGIQNKNNILPQTVIFFPGKKDNAEEFLKRNNIENIPYILLNKEEFITYAGTSFPSMYYLQIDQENYYHWVGGTFNYLALDFISKN